LDNKKQIKEAEWKIQQFSLCQRDWPIIYM